MTTLNVPFKEKDEAKALGARWNPAQRTWYVPDGLDLVNFDRWLPDQTTIPTALPMVNNISQTEPQQGMQLSSYLQRLSNAIRKIYPEKEWVRAEISEWREYHSTVYVSLVEHNEAGQAIAKVDARIWAPYPIKLQEKFQQATGSQLTPGIKVLLAVRAEFHMQYGFSVIIEDVDPSYTLGDMAAKLAKIRNTLTTEKIIDANKQLAVPQEFVRVAVVAPKNAAGLGDFRREADLLQHFNLCQFDYFFATFQGQTASVSVAQALEQAIAAHAAQSFDTIVVIRGGGAVTDLAWLNDLTLARLVCRSPVAVITGIGHERDTTILDEVACVRLDTPSKVINHIFARIKQNAQQAQSHFDRIINTSQRWLQHYQQSTQHLHRLLESLVEQRCRHAAQQTDAMNNTITVQAQHRVDTTSHQIERWQQAIFTHADEQQQRLQVQLDAIWQRIEAQAHTQLKEQSNRVAKNYSVLDQQAHFIQQHMKTVTDGLIREILGQGPQKTLQRGFVIVRNETDNILSSRQKAKTCQQIQLEFHDGILTAKNTEFKKSGD